MIDTEFECAMRAHQERNSNPAVRGGDGVEGQGMTVMEIELRGWKVFEVKVEIRPLTNVELPGPTGLQVYNTLAPNADKAVKIALERSRADYTGELIALMSVVPLCDVDLS